MGTESQPVLIHTQFTLERAYKATPARVFAAWADVETKARWFRGTGDWQLLERSLDFRVGGKEVLHGRLPSGVETLYAVTYHAIHPNARFVYVYDMHHSAVHLSVSLASVELTPDPVGTLMTYTEQAVYFGGNDGTASRKQGTAVHFERLAELLESN